MPPPYSHHHNWTRGQTVVFPKQGSRQEGRGEESSQTAKRTRRLTQQEQQLRWWLVPGGMWGGVGKGVMGLAMGDNKKADIQQLKNFMNKGHDLERRILQKNTPAE